MIKDIYTLGGFYFYSAKEVAEFKTNYPNEWDSVKHAPLRKSGIQMDEYQDFVDYIDGLQNQPDICLAYRADNARGYGYYTTLWCNGLEIRGIFGYHESNTIEDNLVFEMIDFSKWKGLKVRQNRCR